MMESDTIGLDDIVVTLMSMGFEFQDCQDAITNGKLTVQAAVDWIISGKPGNVVAAAQPTLKLNANEAQSSSNPFSTSRRSSTPLQQNPVSSVPPSNEFLDIDVDMTDGLLISRTHMSEKQQQIKVDFEERERQDARRKVQEDKRRKKLEKERILKEIQGDREKQKLIKSNKVDAAISPLEESSQPQHQEPSTSCSSQANENTATSTFIQVRLPTGKVFRQTFSVNATLNNVWDVVSHDMKSALNAFSGFIQPFPRKEYSREEMGNSLQSLGLTPSGALALKKKEADQASITDPPPRSFDRPGAQHFLANLHHQVDGQPAEEREQDGEELEEGGDMRQHAWGRGFRVEQEDALVHNQQEEEEEMDERMEDDDNPFDQHPPIFGHGGRGHQLAFGGYGNRLVTAGVPDDHGRHLNRRAADMAAEAAAQRFAQPRPVDNDEPEPESHYSELLYSASSLQIISMNVLATSLTDPCCPIHSMHGLSEDMLQKFIHFLKREKLLKPKIVFHMPSYLLRLNLDFYSYTTNELIHASRVLVNLQNVSLASCPLITDNGLNALKGMKVLKSLTLQGCSQITDASLSVISELTTLHSLNLDGTGVSDAGIHQLATGNHCPELVHLDLSRTSITHAIIPVLANFTHLKVLGLKQSKIISLSGIERIRSLENIDISETDVVTDSILCLTRLPNLCMVCLKGTRHIIGDTALSYMQDMPLTSLILPNRTSTTDAGLAYITGFQLTSLDLTNYTCVGDPGMVHIGQLLSLKTLLLTNTRITDEGMEQLKELRNLQVLFVDKTMTSNTGAAIVQNFRYLSELSLAGTSITSDLLRTEALNHCISLSKLNLSRTVIGDKGIQFLKLPNLTLLNLDCTRVHWHAADVVKKNCCNIKNVTVANLVDEPEDGI